MVASPTPKNNPSSTSSSVTPVCSNRLPSAREFRKRRATSPGDGRIKAGSFAVRATIHHNSKPASAEARPSQERVDVMRLGAEIFCMIVIRYSELVICNHGKRSCRKR